MEAQSPSTPARILEGRITVHPRGFGFLTAEGGENEVLSAFVIPPDLNPFLADDIVRARLSAAADGRFTASSLELVTRTRTELFGEVVQRRGSFFLRVDREVANTDWPLEPAGFSLKPGQPLVARVEGLKAVAARLVDPQSDLALEQVIARHGLHSQFEDALEVEAQAVMTRPHTLGARRDLRHIPTITVDAPSTRDIDDAISVMPAGPDGALRLLVSIADVAEFVLPDTALDRAARERATSVYLAGRVLPMLPDQLSSHWLSLLPGEERCCLTVELRVDPEGHITATDVYESLIRSWGRVSYAEAAAYLDHGTLLPAVEPVAQVMAWFRTASSRIALARARRGGIEVTRDEIRIVFDTQTGAPSGIESVAPTSAHVMIERFMVAANEAIARWLMERGVPGVFRVHDQPDSTRVQELMSAAHNFGFEPGFGRTLSPLALAAFDHQIQGVACEPALRSVLLRSLGPARYTVTPGPHFGLAAPLYLHFTSPIRRYADLAVHRLIKAYLRGNRDFLPDDPAVERLAVHINHRMRVGARAENDRRRILVARLMAERVGEIHMAHITRVRPFGLVVQLDATLVEGTIPLDSLPAGPYHSDTRETALVGPTRRFELGQAVEVRVVSADAVLGRVELALTETGPTEAHPAS